MCFGPARSSRSDIFGDDSLALACRTHDPTLHTHCLYRLGAQMQTPLILYKETRDAFLEERRIPLNQKTLTSLRISSVVRQAIYTQTTMPQHSELVIIM